MNLTFEELLEESDSNFELNVNLNRLRQHCLQNLNPNPNLSELCTLSDNKQLLTYLRDRVKPVFTFVTTTPYSKQVLYNIQARTLGDVVKCVANAANQPYHMQRQFEPIVSRIREFASAFESYQKLAERPQPRIDELFNLKFPTRVYPNFLIDIGNSKSATTVFLASKDDPEMNALVTVRGADPEFMHLILSFYTNYPGLTSRGARQVPIALRSLLFASPNIRHQIMYDQETIKTLLLEPNFFNTFSTLTGPLTHCQPPDWSKFPTQHFVSTQSQTSGQGRQSPQWSRLVKPTSSPKRGHKSILSTLPSSLFKPVRKPKPVKRVVGRPVQSVQPVRPPVNLPPPSVNLLNFNRKLLGTEFLPVPPPPVEGPKRYQIIATPPRQRSGRQLPPPPRVASPQRTSPKLLALLPISSRPTRLPPQRPQSK